MKNFLSEESVITDELMPSLDALNDIVLPGMPSFWPLGELGMFFLGTLIYLVLLAVFKYYFYWKQQAYRRAGIALAKQVDSTYALAIIMKRVCLAVFPREEVATLSGQAWTDFLNRQCNSFPFPRDFDWQATSDVSQEQIKWACRWIKDHHTRKAVRARK